MASFPALVHACTRVAKNFEYRVGEGGRQEAKKRVTIGRVSHFAVDQARKAADILRSKVASGADPQAAQAEDRQALPLPKSRLSSLSNTCMRSARREPRRTMMTSSTASSYRSLANFGG
ncbi:integrase arm-type DNA-binding domain-containing protein [Devosia sp. CAU 1758]